MDLVLTNFIKEDDLPTRPNQRPSAQSMKILSTIFLSNCPNQTADSNHPSLHLSSYLFLFFQFGDAY